jgi:putative membrane protein
MFHGTYFWSEWWIIFPIFGFITMIFFTIMMIRRMSYWGYRRGYWWEGRGQRDSDSALDILNKRYAQGEISKQEYDQIREDL